MQGIKRNAVLVAGLMQSGVVVVVGGDNVCLFIAYFQAAGAARLCLDLLATYLLYLLTWSTLVKSAESCCVVNVANLTVFIAFSPHPHFLHCGTFTPLRRVTHCVCVLFSFLPLFYCIYCMSLH